MKLILILATICIQIIDVRSKKYRGVLDDELYRYLIDESASFYPEYFNTDQLLMEQIDDDQVRYGGYAECIKSMDPNMILYGSLKTQHQENGIWKDGTIQLAIPDMCAEFLNSLRPWYNFTKLWTKCPPEAGDKWFIEEQIADVTFDVPPSFAKSGRWRGYILFSQGVVKITTKMGIMLQLELVEVN